jgi:hypothetical protein
MEGDAKPEETNAMMRAEWELFEKVPDIGLPSADDITNSHVIAFARPIRTDPNSINRLGFVVET